MKRLILSLVRLNSNFWRSCKFTRPAEQCYRSRALSAVMTKHCPQVASSAWWTTAWCFYPAGQYGEWVNPPESRSL